MHGAAGANQYRNEAAESDRTECSARRRRGAAGCGEVELSTLGGKLEPEIAGTLAFFVGVEIVKLVA